MRIHAAGFCHTDMLVARGTFGDNTPITGSHEAAGVVAAVGAGVEGFGVGDRVIALNKASMCGTCWDCTQLDPAFCPHGKLAGLHVDGAFAEYFLALAAVAVRIPDALSFEKAAPMTCAGITIFEAIRKAAREGLQPGGVLAIVGLGALGHIGVQMAKAMVSNGEEGLTEGILCRRGRRAARAAGPVCGLQARAGRASRRAGRGGGRHLEGGRGVARQGRRRAPHGRRWCVWR